MITLHWIFKNNHAWELTFENVTDAENHAELCGMYKNGAVDRVWIDTPTAQIWLKEKATQ